MTLDPIQLRVLGSLIEKEIATPENYPLSLNALVNACNQRSSRDPVLDLSDDQVRQAVHSLEDMELVSAVHDARVPKYEHRIRTVLNLRRDETALLCLLMLRGPQTPGELRSRCDRLYNFDDLAAVQTTLERLASRAEAAEGEPTATGPLTAILPRQPGAREARFAHLLGGPVESAALYSHGGPGPLDFPPSGPDPVTAERLSRMAADIATLSAALHELRNRIEQLESSPNH